MLILSIKLFFLFRGGWVVAPKKSQKMDFSALLRAEHYISYMERAAYYFFEIILALFCRSSLTHFKYSI